MRASSGIRACTRHAFGQRDLDAADDVGEQVVQEHDEDVDQRPQHDEHEPDRQAAGEQPPTVDLEGLVSEQVPDQRVRESSAPIAPKIAYRIIIAPMITTMTHR